MVRYDLKYFKNSIGKVLSFTVNKLELGEFVPYSFKARLLEVHDNHILVDEFYIETYESGESGYETRELELFNGRFILNSGETPLSH